jgi:hypothetical protein
VLGGGGGRGRGRRIYSITPSVGSLYENQAKEIRAICSV